MYWNENVGIFANKRLSWIVTLDVLKLPYRELNLFFSLGWIVTLDVLK